MSVERETELKFLVGEEAVEQLKADLGEPSRHLVFLNEYYTILPKSERRDWVLRCRKFESQSVLTLKIGREVQPGVFDSTEYSDTVVSDNIADWEEFSVMKVFREQVSTQAIQLQGAVKNERTVFETPLAFGKYWELDRTQYPQGVTVHELEVEIPYGSEEELEGRSREIRDYLAERGIEAKPSRMSKYARFLEALQDSGSSGG